MSKTSVNQLLSSAQESGVITPEIVSIIGDQGVAIQNALGVNIDDINASEVTLVTLIIDDSGSIRFSSNAQIVREGHNSIINALKATKQRDEILAHCVYLNGKILYPYGLVNSAILMDSSNYDPNLGTPLYDQTVVTLGAVLLKAQEFRDNGVPCRTVTCIVTDGADEHSVKNTTSDVSKIVNKMLMSEMHIISAMGIDNGSTDFNQIFESMGIQKKLILTPSNNPSEIRKAFLMVSQSAVNASQGAASFSQTAAGGFGG